MWWFTIFFVTDIFHTTFDWPSNPEIQNRLKEVEGYSEEDMINKLIVFHRHFEGIAECYKKCSKTINADQPKADVFSQGKKFKHDIIVSFLYNHMKK